MNAKKLLKTLTVEEKLGQLVQTYGKFIIRKDPETNIFEEDELNMTDNERAIVGSVLNNARVSNVTHVLKEYLSDEIGGKVPLIAMHDVIHGCDTLFPIALGLACSFDDELVRESSYIAGKEAADRDIHVTFAPMVDLLQDARWGRVMESYGEDVLINSLMGKATVEGFHKAGVMCCAKHFAGYGFVESGREYNHTRLNDRFFKERVLPPYKAVVDAGVDMMMTSYSSVNDIPSTIDKDLIKGTLRKEMGFKGVVISDSNAIWETVGHGVAKDGKEAALLAFNAGVDMDMSSHCYIKYLKELYDEGKIKEKDIDEACLRVLSLKESKGLFESPYNQDSKKPTDFTLDANHIAYAKKCAEKSAVLLKNENVLPISKATKKIALIGPFADTEEIIGSWSCFGDKQYGKSTISTIKSGIEKQFSNSKITHIPACSFELDDNTTNFSKAVRAAKSADAVVLCIGEHMKYSGEATCRADITIPKAQIELAKAVCKANKNTAVVLFCGRPLAIPELDEIAPAILCMWQPGTAGGDAAASLICGDSVPEGRLTMSWPYSVGQCPIYYTNTRTGRYCKTPEQEKIRSMTSNYIDEYTYPLYPFGYGLSYTKFEYSNATLSCNTITKDKPITLSVTIKNSGDFKSSEVVQLYIRDLVGSVVRPMGELKAFKKVKLSPGEETVVTFEITEEMLKFWRKDMTFGSEKGDFEAMVGTNCRNTTNLEFTLI